MSEDNEILGENDDLYELLPGTPSGVASAVIQATAEHHESGLPLEVVEKLERESQRREKKKKFASRAVQVIDNRDLILGPGERLAWLVVAELLRQGYFLSAVCVVIVGVVLWRSSPEQPGPIVKFFKKDVGEMREKLVSMTKTLYRG